MERGQVQEALSRFNSKMVRLKEILLTGPSLFAFSFNSKMVRLKVTRVPVQALIEWGFNSKMVRLKVLRGGLQRAMVQLFQFQNGTIKRNV